jgi:hypothetical protein
VKFANHLGGSIWILVFVANGIISGGTVADSGFTQRAFGVGISVTIHDPDVEHIDFKIMG